MDRLENENSDDEEDVEDDEEDENVGVSDDEVMETLSKAGVVENVEETVSEFPSALTPNCTIEGVVSIRFSESSTGSAAGCGNA